MMRYCRVRKDLAVLKGNVLEFPRQLFCHAENVPLLHLAVFAYLKTLKSIPNSLPQPIPKAGVR